VGFSPGVAELENMLVKKVLSPNDIDYPLGWFPSGVLKLEKK